MQVTIVTKSYFVNRIIGMLTVHKHNITYLLKRYFNTVMRNLHVMSMSMNNSHRLKQWLLRSKFQLNIKITIFCVLTEPTSFFVSIWFDLRLGDFNSWCFSSPRLSSASTSDSSLLAAVFVAESWPGVDTADWFSTEMHTKQKPDTVQKLC